MNFNTPGLSSVNPGGRLKHALGLSGVARDQLSMRILAQLLAEQPVLSAAFEKKLEELPIEARGPFTEALFRQTLGSGAGNDEGNSVFMADYGLLTADFILTCTVNPIVWVVQDLLPVGLTMLAGPPKAGKSFLALQLAKSVAGDEPFLGHEVNQGGVVYLALEDPICRLKERMNGQGWQAGLPAHFLPVQGSHDIVATLVANNCETLRSLIDQDDSRLVIIDTLSRILNGDQNDVRDMTHNLAPIQKLAHDLGCCVVIIDHHRKAMRGSVENNQDPIADILGSTAKAGVADGIWGFYRIANQSIAQLAITGRDVEEQSFKLVFSKDTHSWLVQEGEPELDNPNLSKVLELLGSMGPMRQVDMVRQLGEHKGNVSKRVKKLAELGLIEKVGDCWQVFGYISGEEDGE